MQTFLPESDFSKSAKLLDFRRLGKQRIEAWQIYQALTNPKYGWKNHPAVLMWKGYEKALIVYGIKMCEEWISRGYKDTMLERFQHEFKRINFNLELPSWCFDKSFNDAHKSNLIRKKPEYYKPYWPDIPDNLPYIWPTKIKT